MIFFFISFVLKLSNDLLFFFVLNKLGAIKDLSTLKELQFGQFKYLFFFSFSNSFEEENQLSKLLEQFLHFKLYLITIYYLCVNFNFSILKFYNPN